MLKAFPLSFYSKAFYCDVASNWKGLALGLLFVLVTLHTAFFTFYLNREFNAFLAQDVPHLIGQVPSIAVLDGQVRINKSWPYLIKAKDGSTLVHFDTAFDEAKFPAGQIWVTGDTIYLRRQYDEMRSFSLKNIENFSIDQSMILAWLETAKKWFLAAVFPLLLIVFFILRVIQVFFYSLIGKFLNYTMGVFLTYTQIFRLCVIALVPVLLVDCALLTFMPVQWPYLGFFLAMGFLIFGLRANRDLIR